MAMSDTGSSFLAQWAHELYDPMEPCPEQPRATGFAADGNATVPAAASPTSAGSGASPTKSAAAGAQHPGIEGPRVGKPARRRSRASRRAPVTLLNTDTTNFRAMVQQFTGIPAPPAGAFGAAPLINFAGDYGFPPQHAAGGVMSFDHVGGSGQQHPPALHDQLRRQQQQQQQPQYTGGAPFGYNSLLLQGGDIFASAEDRMLLQSIQQVAQMPPASTANNTSLGFFA